jgi:hypothetical protein
MAEPMRADEAAPRFSLRLEAIDFAAGQLWRARYPTLIDDGAAPSGFQFEPAFQVRSAAPDQEVEVFFRLAGEAGNTEFAALPDGSPWWQLLVPPDPQKPAPDVTVTFADEARRGCSVVWKRSGAPLTALRVACRHLAPEPQDDPVLDLIEGGVYLVIIDRGELPPHGAGEWKKGGSPVPGTVRMLGIDQNGRPVFDLLQESFSVPAGMATEPAFRAPHGARLDLGLRLDLPEIYQEVRFRVAADGQVEGDFATPSWKPESLIGIPAHDESGRACTVRWRRDPLQACVSHSEEAKSPTCLQGRTANFSLMLDLEGLRAAHPDLADAMGSVAIDPTVIEPPACDASGVCSSPRPGDGDGS